MTMPKFEWSPPAARNRRNRAYIIVSCIFVAIGLAWIGVVVLVTYPTKTQLILSRPQHAGEMPTVNEPIAQQLDQKVEGMLDQSLAWIVQHGPVHSTNLGYETKSTNDNENTNQEEHSKLPRSRLPRVHDKAYYGLKFPTITLRSISNEPTDRLDQAANPPPHDEVTHEDEKGGQEAYHDWLQSYIPRPPPRFRTVNH